MKMSSRTLFLAGVLLTVGSLSAGLVYCAQPEVSPTAAWQRLLAADVLADAAKHAPQAVPADARCPVCGMYPARFGKWAAQLQFRDGSVRFFESPREFFVFQRDIAHHGNGLGTADIVGGFVTDYAGSGWVVATSAYFVRGSRLPGPMHSDALPAFATRAAAATFVAEQGGELLTFAQLVAALSAASAADAADMHMHQHQDQHQDRHQDQH